MVLLFRYSALLYSGFECPIDRTTFVSITGLLVLGAGACWLVVSYAGQHVPILIFVRIPPQNSDSCAPALHPKHTGTSRARSSCTAVSSSPSPLRTTAVGLIASLAGCSLTFVSVKYASMSCQAMGVSVATISVTSAFWRRQKCEDG